MSRSRFTILPSPATARLHWIHLSSLQNYALIIRNISYTFQNLIKQFLVVRVLLLYFVNLSHQLIRFLLNVFLILQNLLLRILLQIFHVFLVFSQVLTLFPLSHLFEVTKSNQELLLHWNRLHHNIKVGYLIVQIWLLLKEFNFPVI
jgi:hypothetical protein